jgi:hypothetical protein
MAEGVYQKVANKKDLQGDHRTRSNISLFW